VRHVTFGMGGAEGCIDGSSATAGMLCPTVQTKTYPFPPGTAPKKATDSRNFVLLTRWWHDAFPRPVKEKQPPNQRENSEIYRQRAHGSPITWSPLYRRIPILPPTWACAEHS
jgi:hypothetical protein